jgi:hypothetical protein
MNKESDMYDKVGYGSKHKKKEMKKMKKEVVRDRELVKSAKRIKDKPLI